ncbi:MULTISPECIES: hypothetical protein [Caballeronia]|uniref:Uncharacterized protein n=1 Tax=Caballeronia grimmiae TaxID=1071679 RepID=A0A069NJG8_9BURK|nr:hypothetical protein [Caballeronia grimmiae]KDR28362.1 hypothetical protein BG57_19480 [Caballeronia grimmiae]GGD62149.1 hypothetical protein GCM10010985_15360 [Caballeronia grimmiae]
MSVQSPLVSRSASRFFTDRCGIYPDCRFMPVVTILSRRSVRRRNAIAARAFIAVDCVGAASLLP